MLDAKNVFKDCRVEVWSERYAVVKARQVPEIFLAVFNDQEETTVVVPENALADDWVIEAEQGWKLLSFRVVLPFELTGFLAVVAKVLAEEEVAIFVLSAYSTDHLLVKESDLAAAQRTLASLGCQIVET